MAACFGPPAHATASSSLSPRNVSGMRPDLLTSPPTAMVLLTLPAIDTTTCGRTVWFGEPFLDDGRSLRRCTPRHGHPAPHKARSPFHRIRRPEEESWWVEALARPGVPVISGGTTPVNKAEPVVS